MKRTMTMIGRVDPCVQLTYRTPADSVKGRLPEGLELVTRGPWAFWNVMACRVDQFRPSGLPAVAGLGYRHIAYRLVTQAMTDRAQVVRGYYDTHNTVDTGVLSALTRRHLAGKTNPMKIKLKISDCGLIYQAGQGRHAEDSDTAFELDIAHAPAGLMPDSCFPTTEDVRQFCATTTDSLAVIEREGERRLRVTPVQRTGQARSETPLAVHHAHLGYFDTIDQARHVHLEYACRLGPAEVRWSAPWQQRLLLQPRKATHEPAMTPAQSATAPILS